MEIRPANANPWLLTIVYGSPHFTPRQTLWDEIQSLSHNSDGAWLLMGDFNDVLHDLERVGPPMVRAQPIESGFQQTLQNSNLMDMGFNEDPFTWSRGNTRNRLDRAICNLDWRIRFGSVEIYHLPNKKFDHAPLLLDFDLRRMENRRRRPFRFEAIWLSHPSFKQLVVDNWRNQLSNFPQQLKEFQGVLMEWNKDVFGNVFHQKKILVRKLRDIDMRLYVGWSDQLLQLQKVIWEAYEDILPKEDILWFQKSRAKWIELGDRNTVFPRGDYY